MAYFNPGMFTPASGVPTFDAASWHTRYITRKVSCGSPQSPQLCDASYILMTSRLGFWVLEIEPQVRLQLGLPLQFNTASYFFGRPARPPEIFD